MPAAFPELGTLPADEKILLAAELFEEAAVVGDDVQEPDPAIVAILEERLEEYHRNPESALSWEGVKRKVRANG